MNDPGSLSIGYLPSTNSSDTSKQFSLAAGARWEAVSFVPNRSVTLNTIRWFVEAIGGTGGAATIDIYSDSSNAPNVSLANSSTTSGSIAANTWVTQTGFSLALTAGTKYWIVIRNTDASPTTNYFQIRFSTASLPTGWAHYVTESGFRYNESVNSGSSWGNDNGEGLFPFRLGFSDSSYFGFPVGKKIRHLEGAAGQGVYSTREFGAYITTPANFSPKVKGVSFQVSKIGTPTGNLRYRIYAGASLVDTTEVFLPASFGASGGIIPLFFENAVQLSGSTVYRIVASETTQSDTSSNRYNLTTHTHVDSDSNSQALKPWGSTSASTYYDGSTWTEVTTEIVPFALILSSGDEFGSAGGGLKNFNSVSGGVQ